MRKMVFGRKFSRGKKGRIALFRSLIRAMILNGKIITTKAKAKAIQKDLDKYIVKAMANSLVARRKVLAEMGNAREVVDALFMKVAPSFKRKSGFTKIISLPRRKGDASPMVRLEWSEVILEKKEEKKEKEEKKGEKKEIKIKKTKKSK